MLQIRPVWRRNRGYYHLLWGETDLWGSLGGSGSLLPRLCGGQGGSRDWRRPSRWWSWNRCTTRSEISHLGRLQRTWELPSTLVVLAHNYLRFYRSRSLPLRMQFVEQHIMYRNVLMKPRKWVPESILFCRRQILLCILGIVQNSPCHRPNTSPLSSSHRLSLWVGHVYHAKTKPHSVSWTYRTFGKGVHGWLSWNF